MGDYFKRGDGGQLPRIGLCWKFNQIHQKAELFSQVMMTQPTVIQVL